MVTRKASLTQKGDTPRQVHGPTAAIFAPQQMYPWISRHQSAQLEYSANNWQKVHKTEQKINLSSNS